MKNKATVYMIPVPIADGAANTLPQQVKDITATLKYYVVENLRSARRFLKLLHPSIVIDDIDFTEIDKHKGPDFTLIKKWLYEGKTFGVLSEAGCPGIADPGAEIAATAQYLGAKVVPLAGPNSIILALMASGMNGQGFCFNGYLPVKDPARSQKIKAMEAISTKEKQTQIFIETPYRNDTLLNDLIRHCQSHTRVCIAVNINAPEEMIITKTIADWRKDKPLIGKHPAVFLLIC